jgi:hypothetical protein
VIFGKDYKYYRGQIAIRLRLYSLPTDGKEHTASQELQALRQIPPEHIWINSLDRYV